MKRLKILLSILACSALLACQSTPQKIAVDTLSSLGQGVNDSYEAYLTTVAQGTSSTNQVPTITGYYRDFQVAFGAAAAAAHFATNTTLATPELLSLAQKVTTAISVVKGSK